MVFVETVSQNLLLTVRGDSCYFLALTEDADFNQLSAEHRTETEVSGSGVVRGVPWIQTYRRRGQ